MKPPHVRTAIEVDAFIYMPCVGGYIFSSTAVLPPLRVLPLPLPSITSKGSVTTCGVPLTVIRCVKMLPTRVTSRFIDICLVSSSFNSKRVRFEQR